MFRDMLVATDGSAVADEALSQGIQDEDDPMTAPRYDLEVPANPIIVSKKRYGAFSGSRLDTILRAHDYRHLVLSGFVTSGVALSTVRQAFDLTTSSPF